jgi:heat shock protein HtpX
LSTLHLLREQIAANRRAYQVTVAIVVAALALLGLLVTLVLGLGVSGLGAGLGLAVLVVGFAPGIGERAALRDAGAQPADPARWSRYANLVDGLAAAAGLPRPRLYVADSDAANAFSVGRNPEQSALVVTTGLLTTLNRVELEGVLAHELNHIWSWGARLATLGVALGRVPGLLPLLAPARREFDADEGGARLTRYPPGLVSALRKLAQLATGTPDRPSLRHLWIMAPGDATHPPVDERIAALQEL